MSSNSEKKTVATVGGGIGGLAVGALLCGPLCAIGGGLAGGLIGNTLASKGGTQYYSGKNNRNY